MSPKFNMLIRFTLEIFLLLVLASKFAAEPSHAAVTANEARAESQESARPGRGINMVRISLVPSAATPVAQFRDQSVPFTGVNALSTLSSTAPDQIIVRLEGGPAWQELLRYALERDIPVAIELGR